MSESKVASDSPALGAGRRKEQGEAMNIVVFGLTLQAVGLLFAAGFGAAVAGLGLDLVVLGCVDYVCSKLDRGE